MSDSSVSRYIVRRSFYSLLVIIGVLLLTFLLFRVAAGDPARTVLGKNPSPQEVENMRLALSSGKPLVWGSWRATEIYTSANFAEQRSLPGISVGDTCKYTDSGLLTGDGAVVIDRNFAQEDMPEIRMMLEYAGKVGIVQEFDEGRILESEFSAGAGVGVGEFLLNSGGGAPPRKIFLGCSGDGSLLLKSVSFQRRQDNPWDSQFMASLKEIVSFKGTFPYVSFFNFGRTLITREPVKVVLLRGVWPSLALMLPIFLGELALGIILALLSTAYRGRWPDRLIMLVSVAGMSVSYVVFMIFGQWFLGYHYNIFPVWGYGEVRHLVLPVIIGIVSGLGGGVRFYRTVFVNELRKEYLRTAEAKGCSFSGIYFKHLLRNAAVPLITRASSILPFLFTGSLLLESFFGIPGLGFAGINALMNSDLQMLKALVILTAILFVAINLLADITYAWADPRARLE